MKTFLRENKKNLKIISYIILLIVLFLVINSLYKLIKKESQKKISSQENLQMDKAIIEEKEMSFEELEIFQKEMKKKYPEQFTKIYKCVDSKEYYNHDETEKNSQKPHALIFVEKGYSLSEKIKLPYCIFIPQINDSKVINGNKYFDLELKDLKEYCKSNNKDIYIIKIKNFLSKEKSLHLEVDINKQQLSLPPTTLEKNQQKTYIIEKLDDIWTHSDFLPIKHKISPSCFLHLSDRDEDSNKLDTILYVKDEQLNNITKNDGYKMFIFVEISNEEKEQKKYKDTDDKINSIFNKKYRDLTLEDINKTENRKIIIFKIKYADYCDKNNNPKSETEMS